MEQNNLTNQEKEKAELKKPVENTGEVISDLESQENQVSIIDDVENTLKVQAELQMIANKTKAEIDKYNQTRINMGLDPVDVNENNIGDHIPSLKSRFKKWGSNLMKAGIFAGLMFSANEGLAQNKSEKDADKAHKEWVEKQYQLYKKGALKDGNLVKGPDGGIYKIGSLDNKVSKKDNSLEGGEQKTSLNISQFFKTGTTEFIDSEAKQNAKESLRDFLKNADLKNFKINVLGTYSVDRPYENNKELAEARRDLGNKILLEVLKEKYSPEEISKIVIEAEAKGKSLLDSFTQEKIEEMSQIEKDKAIDQNQGISFKLESMKKREIKELAFQKTFNNLEDFKNVRAVIVDNSNSMREDVDKVSEFIKEINLENKKLNKKAIDIFTVEGKDKEAHLNTFDTVLSQIEKSLDQEEIVLITDEPDNESKGEEYNKKIEQILKKAKDKNIKIIVKILNSSGGTPFKIFELDQKNKDTLLSNSKDEAAWFASLEDRP